MTLNLTDKLITIPGVGNKRELTLNQLGIFTVMDLLTYFPMRYDDLVTKKPSESLDGQKVTFKGVVSSLPVLNRFGNKKSRVTFRLLVEHDNISVTFFNQPWLMSQLELGQELAVLGTYQANKQQMIGMKQISGQMDKMSAIYPSNQHIKSTTIQKLITDVWQQITHPIPDLLPPFLMQKYRLMSRDRVLEGMHFPTDLDQSKQARRTAAFEEFFVFQMRLQLIKQIDQKSHKEQLEVDNRDLKDFVKSLPFELTDEQKKVVREIITDLTGGRHMNRLLQGDVGSGKTVVAAIAMLAVVSAKKQAALMAPTEILAQQHARNLSDMYAKSGLAVRVEVLTSGMKAAARRQILEDLASGAIDIIVGTHALIQPDVLFHHLVLAVIDEQHRFGVNQRAKLRENGLNPDILSMTATPIPRTLAITAYGEMDVSTIEQLPSGRQAITTKWVKQSGFDQVLEFVKSELKKGQQAYVVAPLIEESEAIDVQNATALYEQLQMDFAPDFQVGMLHGKLSNAEKQQIMTDFKQNKLQVLVATTVVEVGVDVPNATVMLIVDADRFGLAQLHQLRGRVGRGVAKSYAFLVSDPKTDYGKERMKAMIDTQDGFVLAQKDLELRGGGDILGTKQSGLPEFKVGDPVENLKMMEVAQMEAEQLIQSDHWDQQVANQNLVGYLSETMGNYKYFD